MKSNAKAILALSIGFMCLTLGVSIGQLEIIQEIIREISKSATAWIPTP